MLADLAMVGVLRRDRAQVAHYVSQAQRETDADIFEHIEEAL